MKRMFLAIIVAIVAALLSLFSPVGSKSHTPQAHAATGPCGTLSLSSTHYQHVIWVWMENHSYDTIIGSSQAPYINGLATSCGLATNYHDISHPSLPNYIAGTSGLGLADIQQFTSDCNPSKRCSTSAPSIFSQTPSWKAYEESMPSNCFRRNSGEYAVRHKPPAVLHHPFYFWVRHQ